MQYPSCAHHCGECSRSELVVSAYILSGAYSILTLYEHMTANAIMASHESIKIYMDALMLGVKLQYMVSASFHCFSLSVKS